MKILTLQAVAANILAPASSLVVLVFIARRLVRSEDKADLLVAAVGLLFFTFRYAQMAVYILLILLNGSSFDAVEKFSMTNNHPEVQRNFLLGWAIFFTAVIGLILMTRISLKPASRSLNAFSWIILVVLLGNGAFSALSGRSSATYESDWAKMIAELDGDGLVCPDNPPDIFYIIPDTYTSAAALQRDFQFDNALFLAFLKEKGFVVAQDGRSNYAQTPLSIASSLNFMYLDEVVAQVGDNSDNRSPLQEMIQDNKISALLRHCGYKIVAFSSGFGITDMQGVEFYLEPKGAVSDLQSEMLNLTPIPTIMTVIAYDNRYQLHRERILFTLEQLPQIREQIPGPVFVFAHLTAPHHPFVFDAEGNALNPSRSFTLSEDFRGAGRQEYVQGYLGQLVFLNRRFTEILPQIIAQDPEGTIIIIQGDHGSSSRLDWNNPDKPGMRERLSILNAYYLPGHEDDPSLEGITPVNTFRLVLNAYFGANLPLLENISYFSTLEEPYMLRVIR